HLPSWLRLRLAAEPQALTPMLAMFIALSGTWQAGTDRTTDLDRPLLRRLGSWRAHIIHPRACAAMARTEMPGSGLGLRPRTIVLTESTRGRPIPPAIPT